ncbi:MAG: hypothetical protein H8E42_06565 [Nitrospinae bacterium]|nr:hypothetical protein [Nitrospinota bacterium]MBL7019673.1 hypothetical protein [Nitrospinaceae bacterium]
MSDMLEGWSFYFKPLGMGDGGFRSVLSVCGLEIKFPLLRAAKRLQVQGCCHSKVYESAGDKKGVQGV